MIQRGLCSVDAEASMKHFIGVGVFVVLALVARFGLSRRFGLGIPINATYWIIPLRIVGFWLLMGIAAVCLLIAAYGLLQHSS